MAVSFLINKSQGLKFLDTYKEEFTPTNYFSATKEQFMIIAIIQMKLKA